MGRLHTVTPPCGAPVLAEGRVALRRPTAESPRTDQNADPILSHRTSKPVTSFTGDDAEGR